MFHQLQWQLDFERQRANDNLAENVKLRSVLEWVMNSLKNEFWDKDNIIEQIEKAIKPADN